MKANLLSEIATRKKLQTIIGFTKNLPDPDKILMANNYNYEIYRDLLTDGHLSANIMQRKMQILQMGWEIEADEEIETEIIEIIGNLNLNKIGSEMLDVIFFGLYVGEIEWKYENKKYYPVDIEGKPQEWFIFNNDNQIRLRKKENNIYYFEEGIELPEEKFIVMQNNPTYVNPYGEKVLSKVYWPIQFKRSAIEAWNDLGQKFGIPFLVGYYSSTANEEDKQKLMEAVEEMIENRIALLLDGTKIEFKENMKYEVGGLFEKFIEMMNKEISKAVLSETLTTDLTRTGSYSATEIHQQILEYIGLGDKKYVEFGINEMIKKYLRINYGNKYKARFRLKRKDKIIESTIERDKILKELGVKFTAKYFQKRYNLAEDDFEME